MALNVNSDIVKIFAEGTDGAEPNYYERVNAMTILEDAQSPFTTRLVEKLYTEVIEKGHIDFDDIPESSGDIKSYKGYKNMMEVLNNIINLANQTGGNKDAAKYAGIITTTIKHLEALGQYYKEGYQKKSDIVMLEYNLMVFCCVQATSAILSQYVEIIKGFKDNYSIAIKNSKYNANLFYFEQLEKYNKTVETTNYPLYLRSAMETEGGNFVGYTAVGVGVAALAIVAIVIPVLRKLVYFFFALRTKLSDACALQATYLEFNKVCLENNQMMDQTKRDRIIKKQEAIRKIFERMAEKLRVEMVAADKKSTSTLEKEDKKMKKSAIQDDVENAVGGFLL